jgi:hypothetical protein
MQEAVELQEQVVMQEQIRVVAVAEDQIWEILVLGGLELLLFECQLHSLLPAPLASSPT